MEVNLPTCSPRHAPPQCSRTNDPDLQVTLSLHPRRGIQHIPQLPLGQTPTSNQTQAESTLTIQHCPSDIRLRSLQRPLQILCHSISSPRQPKHHLHQTRHPQILVLPRLQRFRHRPALEHYRCFHVVNATTKSIIISDTIKVLHDYLTQPEVTSEDRIVHSLKFLSCAVKDASTTIHHKQLSAIYKLRDLLSHWKTNTALVPPSSTPTVAPPPTMVSPPKVVPPRTGVPPPRVDPSPIPRDHPSPTTAPLTPPAQSIPKPSPVHEPMAHRTLSQTISPVAAASRRYPSAFLTECSISFLDPSTGQYLEHCQLRHHPHLGPIWGSSYSNELGFLCQGVDKGPTSTVQRTKGTVTFRVIRCKNIPRNQLKGITVTKVFCKFRQEKEDPNCTRITIMGN